VKSDVYDYFGDWFLRMDSVKYFDYRVCLFFVCQIYMFVHSHISKTMRPNFTTFPAFSSVLCCAAGSKYAIYYCIECVTVDTTSSSITLPASSLTIRRFYKLVVYGTDGPVEIRRPSRHKIMSLQRCLGDSTAEKNGTQRGQRTFRTFSLG